MGYKPGMDSLKCDKPSLLFLLGADADKLNNDDLHGNAGVIYIGESFTKIRFTLFIPLGEIKN